MIRVHGATAALILVPSAVSANQTQFGEHFLADFSVSRSLSHDNSVHADRPSAKPWRICFAKHQILCASGTIEGRVCCDIKAPRALSSWHCAFYNMFAVPGWAVSPKSLVQQGSASKDTTFSLDSKKRKRIDEGDPQRRKLSGSDLEKLWNRSFGKNEKSSSQAIQPAPNEQNQSEVGQKTPEPRSKPKRQSVNLEDVKARHTRPHNLKSAPDHAMNPLSDGSNMPNPSPASTKPNLQKSTKRVTKERKIEELKAKPDLPSPTIVDMPQQLPPVPTATLTPLQTKMRNKLTSARFRHLNQTLYTSSSSDALELFKASPDLFAEYHNGFSQQVKESWPQNPVDEYIRQIKQRGQVFENQEGGSQKKSLPLPRRKTGNCIIADLGCGDAPLARSCQSQIKALKLKFHNFDLHAPNSHVTVADVSSLPLRDGEVDIAIFCLSLMGTNWISFVEEAWRILRGDGKGEVWVAEVKSRFGRVTKQRVVENSVGKKKKPKKPKPVDGETGSRVNGEELFADDSLADQTADETDISAFVRVFARRGFILRGDSVSKSNKMFVSMVFVKSGIPTAGKYKGLRWNGNEYQKMHDGRMRFVGGDQDDQDVSSEEEAKVLKPCVYKTR